MFYGDVIKWYQSSNSKKILHSLNEGFADRFTTAVDNLKNLSRLVQRAVSCGSGAETRVTRLAVEGVEDDLRAGFQGLAREQRELRHGQKMLQIAQAKHTAALERLQDPKNFEALANHLWNRIGSSGMALLVGQKENMETDKKFTFQLTAIEDQGRIPDGSEEFINDDRHVEGLDDLPAISSLSQTLEQLLPLIPQGARNLDLHIPPAITFDQRISIALERWVKSKKSTLLYLEAEAPCAQARMPHVSIAAARIVGAAEEMNLQTISFFCGVPSDGGTVSSTVATRVDKAAPILGLLYSLMFQLLGVIPTASGTSPPIDDIQAASLDGTIASLEKAIGIFSRLLASSPPFLICVIDSFHVFESSVNDTTHTRDLLTVIRKSLEAEGKVIKFLFTDSKRAFSLLPEVPSACREIVEGVRRVGVGRMGPPAGRGFADLSFDN